MKKQIINIVCAVAALAMTGCNDWLDMSPTDKISDQIVWSDENNIKQYVNGFYAYLSRYGSFETQDSQVGLTDGLTETLKYGSIVDGTHVGFANTIAFAQGGLSAQTAAFHFGNWDSLYERIRRVNEFLYNLKQYGGWLDAQTSTRYEAQVRFFRGYLYWQLLKRTPDAIIYDENLLAIRENMPLSTPEKGWDMVQRDLEFAAQNLPPKWTGSEEGRVTSGAAYALLSRAMLYAERWDVAKTAAEEVFKLGYELMPGTTATDYAEAFTSVRDGNKEAILEYNYLKGGPNHKWDQLFMPGGDNATMGGRATPTQEMVESYEKATGGYPDWTPWHTAEGTTQTPPYAELEPRFHASVLYNGCEWKGRTIEPYVDGTDGWATFNDGTDLNGRTTTGYYLRKMLDANYTDYSSACTQPWIAIRLAEVYLNHAEACYMLGNAEDAANEDVRKIRARVGLPYTSLSGDELMDAIRHERKIELYCEGHHYWDMRRWRLAHIAFTGPGARVHGLKITKDASSGDFTYTYVDCDHEDRLFEEKLYRIPLPLTELDNNSEVRQFPEWL